MIKIHDEFRQKEKKEKGEKKNIRTMMKRFRKLPLDSMAYRMLAGKKAGKQLSTINIFKEI